MNPLRAWNTFWFRPISARPLGAFRIVIGVLTLAHLALSSVDLDYWLTDAGMLRGDEARVLAGPLRPSPLQWVQDPVSVRIFMASTVAVALAFTLGWRTRFMSIALYLGLLSFHHRSLLTNSGPDNLLLLIVFYLMLSPCGMAYSLDALRIARRRGTLAEPIIIPWAQRLIQLHLCLIYLDSAVLKCAGTSWLGGTALHYVFNNSEVGGRFDLSALTQYPILINLLTTMSLGVEFLLAFWLWFRPVRPRVIACGIALHGGILFVINVPLFGELMTACYLTFLTSGELDTLLRVLNPMTWLRGHATEVQPIRRDTSIRFDRPESPRGMHTSANEGSLVPQRLHLPARTQSGEIPSCQG